MLNRYQVGNLYRVVILKITYFDFRPSLFSDCGLKKKVTNKVTENMSSL